jgi:hypothetical protein
VRAWLPAIAVAPHRDALAGRSTLRISRLGARALVPVALAGAVLFTFAPPAAGPVAAAGPKTEAQQIIDLARKQIGDPWRYGATGPKAFDCSGLVTYAFKKTGNLKAIGNGKYRSARALYGYFKAKGLADRKNPKLGDLVIWGGGTHVGIYIGKGRAISTLTSGVRIHGIHAVRASFTAFLHTGMSKPVPKAPSAEPEVQPEGANVTASPVEIRQTMGAVNLRKGPGITRARLTTLRGGTRLVVLDRARDGDGRTWIQVQAGSRVGWVAGWLTD